MSSITTKKLKGGKAKRTNKKRRGKWKKENI
jgi:hypothetical protein